MLWQHRLREVRQGPPRDLDQDLRGTCECQTMFTKDVAGLAVAVPSPRPSWLVFGLEATDTLRSGYWLGLPLGMPNDGDLEASRNAPGHSGRRIPHPLSQTRLRTTQMAAHELLTSGQIPVVCA